MKRYYKVIFCFVRQKNIKKKRGIRPVILTLILLGAYQLSFAQQTISCGKNKVLVCHKGKNTLCVSESAVQAHLDHGDYLGPCSNSECDVFARGGEITCNDSVITLTAISGTTGVTYSWSGPDNFTSTLDTPETDVAGIYAVTVTDTNNGCMATDTALVTENTLLPGAIAIGETLTCINTSVLLTGNSEIPGVIFKWTGPGGFTSTLQNPETSVPGEYILTIMNPLNGCISVDTTIIHQNITAPQEVTATVQDILTCTQTAIMLTGTSVTNGVTYNWSGPNGFTSSEQNPVINNPGIYSLLVTNPDNECTSSASILVEQDASPPADVSATVSGILTCGDTSVALAGTLGSSGVSYNWSGPDSFSSDLAMPNVSIPGIYTLTVTNPVNGCSKSSGVTVKQNIAIPENVTAAVNDTLSCTVTSVILSASSTTNGLTYLWTGPQGFISNEQNTVTVLPGNYNLMATDPENGCTSVKQVAVIEEECQESL